VCVAGVFQVCCMCVAVCAAGVLQCVCCSVLQGPQIPWHIPFSDRSGRVELRQRWTARKDERETEMHGQKKGDGERERGRGGKKERCHMYACDNTNEACHIYEEVTSHTSNIIAVCGHKTKMSHVTYVCATIQMRHVTYMKESCHISAIVPQFVSKTQKGETSHTCMRKYVHVYRKKRV